MMTSHLLLTAMGNSGKIVGDIAKSCPYTAVYGNEDYSYDLEFNEAK